MCTSDSRSSDGRPTPKKEAAPDPAAVPEFPKIYAAGRTLAEGPRGFRSESECKGTAFSRNSNTSGIFYENFMTVSGILRKQRTQRIDRRAKYTEKRRRKGERGKHRQPAYGGDSDISIYNNSPACIEPSGSSMPQPFLCTLHLRNTASTPGCRP